jgi:LPXTG-motif cell wall-anchored protein
VPVVNDEFQFDRAGQPGARRYVCDAGTFLLAGQTRTMDIRLRVDTVTANATGTVRVNAPCPCEGRQRDANPANDVAKIVVNPAAGGGGGGGTDDDGLPITGSPITPLVTVGLLLLVGGVAAVLAGRRRRS